MDCLGKMISLKKNYLRVSMSNSTVVGFLGIEEFYNVSDYLYIPIMEGYISRNIEDALGGKL